MRERPILFSAPMVRALLADRKTMTRRALNERDLASFKAAADLGECGRFLDGEPITPGDRKYHSMLCRYGEPGDRLWVRETWSGRHEFRDTPPSKRSSFVAPYGPVLHEEIWYWADGNPEFGDWESPRPSIHMPRYASRLLLEVTEVRIERLHSITEQDARAEGVETGEFLEDLDRMHSIAPRGVPCQFPTLRDEFEKLWKKINGWESWGVNPWVWAVSFRKVEA